MTQPVGTKLPRVTTEHTVREWLDALATGACTQEAFLLAMQERFRSDPDGNWEVLSLLDQYYRRGKIRAEIFLAIKSSLSSSAMGTRDASDSEVRQRVAETASAPPPVPPEPPRECRPGDVLRARYRIQGLVGQGGMGTVYEAIDDYRLDVPPNGRTIALKILHTEVTQRSELLNELRREFQHLQMLSHPNIVRVHEFDRDGPVAFFTMEMLHGMLLSRILSARHGVALDRPQALAILRDTGAAVAHAHGAGVVHGDINPQNIFITNDGAVRVLDFGTSHRFLGALPGGDSGPVSMPFATPAYASCQVLEGERPDASDDVFALGCVAYLLLTGAHPFKQRTAIEARESRLWVRRPRGLSSGQWQALKSALRFKRDKRPSDVAAWLARMDLNAAAPRLGPIDEMINLETVSYRKYVPVVAYSLLGLLLLAGGAWTATHWNVVSQTATAWSGTAGANLEGWSKKLRPGADPNDFHNFAIKRPREGDAAPPAPTPEPASLPTTPAPASSNATTVTPSPAPAVPAPSTSPAPTAASGIVPAAPATTQSTAPSSAAAAAASAAMPPARPGSVRIEMALDAVDVAPEDTVAHITVRRRGNLHAKTDFSWWTESGTAKPGTDFAPVGAHVEHFEDGKNAVVLSVPLVSTLRAQLKSFYVMIDQTAEGGASLGQRTVTMVTLPPSH